MSNLRRIPSYTWTLLALVFGITLGGLFRQLLEPVAQGVGTLIRVIVALVPLLIIAALSPAIATLVRRGLAGRFAGAVILWYVLSSALAGLIGLLAGPGGALIGALAGLGAGGAAGKLIDEGFSDKFLKNLKDYLQPGSAALILLMENEWVKPLSESMAGEEGFVFQQPLTDRLVEDLMGAGGDEQ